MPTLMPRWRTWRGCQAKSRGPGGGPESSELPARASFTEQACNSAAIAEPSADAACGGWRAQQALEEVLVDQYSRILTLDKVTSHLMLQGLGVPSAMLSPVYAPSARPGPFLQLCNEQDLGAFLSRPPRLPLHVKAAFGVKGKRNLCIVEADATGVLTGAPAKGCRLRNSPRVSRVSLPGLGCRSVRGGPGRNRDE